ncbi:O-antigen polysaccharide polymerase Wzy [Acinetobacter junii]|uniref:O-antigen polysaccharide polymerase Wzy n=1 Tax=Acinetobacter junii TaxID=40215 RepID=UPI003FA1DC50
MSMQVAFSSLLFLYFEVDVIVSISVLANFLVCVITVVKNSYDKHFIKLPLVYLLGFFLFICGRFVSNIFGMGETFCFDFGYYYCLSTSEIIYSHFVISSSLIFFTYGFISSRKINFDRGCESNEFYVNYYTLYFVVILGLLLGFYTLHNTFQSILKAINYGYLALYSGQIEAYTSPVGLIVMVLFNAIVAICFSFRHVIDKKLFFLIVSVFVFNLCVSVLAGSRANFVSAVLILIWILMGEKKVNVARISIGFLFIISIFLTNYFASLTGARVAVEDDSSLYKKIIEDIFYNQGITMMVFNMSIREDGYPLLAYVKTIIPGSQIVFSWFSEVYNYQLSFSQHLMYKISPQLFYEGYGLAWSLLGDFYLFSFGFIFVFFFYNFIWGRVLFIVSSCFHKDSFYKGLYFCFLSSIFIINRFSISSFLVLIAFYFFLSKLVKIKWS